MTQKERAEKALNNLRNLSGALRGYADELKEVTDLAQNPPPDGMADGSIDEPEWNRFRGVAMALKTVLDKLG